MNSPYTPCKSRRWKSLVFTFALLCGYTLSQAQITVSSDKSASILAGALVGGGVTITSSTLTCHGAANGLFTTGAVDPLGGIPGGIVLTTGTVVDTLSNTGISHPSSAFETSSYGTPGDASLATLAGTTLSNTHDACVLEFDFNAMGDTIKFNYVFASEEYPEYACTSFNDVFGFLISGPSYGSPTNIALVPGTTIPVCINSINPGPGSAGGVLSNCTMLGPGSPFASYYVDNSTSSYLIYDGMTTVFTAVARVTPCATYHLKLGVADVGDAAYNSGVFIQGGSLTSTVPSAISSSGTSGLPYCIRGCGPGKFTFTIPTAQDTPVTVHYVISGSAVNGYDYATIPTTATIPALSTSTNVFINTLLVPPAGPKVVTLTILVPNPCIPDSFTVGAVANLTILDSFSFKILTPDTSICRGESLTLRAQGDPFFDTILTYTWSPASSLATTTLLTPVIATPTVTTTYTLTGTANASLACPVKKLMVTVTVYDPPAITLDSSVVRTCVGVPVQLHASIPGTTIPMSYLWTPPTDLNSSTIWNPVVTPSVAGDFTYTVSVNPTANIYCVSRDTVHVHVLPNDFILQNPDTAICLGEFVQTRIIGSNEFLWHWAPPAGVSNVFLKTPVITPTVSNSYTVTASYAHCPDMAHSFAIEVDTAAHPINIVDTICLGMTYTIDLTVPGSTGTGSGYYHYQWAPSTYVSNDTIPNPVITPTVASSLLYTITTKPHAASCAVTSTISLEVLPNQISVFPADTAICLGESVQVRATGGHPAFTYLWLPTAGIPAYTTLAPIITPDTSANYVVTAHFHGCPDLKDTMHIDVQPNPTAFIGGNRFVCKYDTLHIHAGVAPTWYNNYIYSWTPSTSLQTTTGSTVVFNGTDTATVIMTVTTANGRCKTIDSAKVIVYPQDSAYINPVGDFCPHDSAVLSPQGGVSYVWSPSLYLNDPTALNPVIKPFTNQTYSVIATNVYGCKDTISYTARVHPAATMFLPDSVKIYPGESYQIKPQTNCVTAMWFPSAGLSNPFVIDPLAMPELNTKYIVNGVTEWGCRLVDSIDVYVDMESILAVPNAFTPGSGANGEFKIIKRGIATLKYFRIFNRWGNVIFETTDIDKGWNGEFNGVPQPFDVYVYQIEAVTNTGAVFKKYGNVTLLR